MKKPDLIVDSLWGKKLSICLILLSLIAYGELVHHCLILMINTDPQFSKIGPFLSKIGPF